MKQYCSLVVLLIFLCGCGGGDHGTKPIVMRGELYFNSKTKQAKVALISLDLNDNWVTVSSSAQITKGADDWDWGSFSLDLPIVDKDSVYNILPYNDKNGNNKFDGVDNESLIKSVWYFAVYDKNTNIWKVWDDNGDYVGTLPAYVLQIEAEYSRSVQSLTQVTTAPVSLEKLKQDYKRLRIRVEGY